MRTKTEKAINLFESGCLKEALSIFRTFRIGFTKEERRTLQIASESLAGNENFYQQIGIDTDSMISKSVEIITEKYLSNEKVQCKIGRKACYIITNFSKLIFG